MDAAPPPQLNDFRIVSAEERAAASPVSTPVLTPPPPENESAPPAPSDVKPVDAAPAAAPVKTTESTPTPPVVVAAAALTKPETKAEAKAEPKPEPKAVVEKKPEPAKPAEKPAEKKDSKDAKDQAGQYYIQVGVFADADNVKQVRAKLKTQGISSWTEEATGNLAGKTRVKAGPFPSKDAADKALAKITKAGLNGMIAKK